MDNVFPDRESGDVLVKNDVATNTARVPGFNWTSYALINYLETKNVVKKRIDVNGTVRCCNNPKGNGECEYFGVDKTK